MQTLALENYGATELSFDEQRETDGGNPWIIWAAAATLAYYGNELSKEIQKGWDLKECSHK